jgi:hypothetical protein
LPKSAEKRDGRIVMLHAATIHRFIVDRETSKGGAATSDDSESGELRKAKLKAEIRKLEEQILGMKHARQELEKTFVPLHEIKEACAIFSHIMRDCGRQAEKAFGLDGRELIDSVLDAMLLNYKRFTGQEKEKAVLCVERDGVLVVVNMADDQ